MRPPADLATGNPLVTPRSLGSRPVPAAGRERGALRRPWPFRRVAVVLSGGGALAAYEVGALNVLEAVGLRPAILAGVSAGAINAVVWLSLGFRTEPLARTWKSLRPSSVGVRWVTLALRAAGGFLAALAALEALLTLAGSPEVGLLGRLRGAQNPAALQLYSALVESAAWAAAGLGGLLVARFSHELEDAVARVAGLADPERWRRWLGWGLGVGVAAYGAVLALGVAWPRRLHASLLLAGALAWLANRPGRGRSWLRDLFLRLMPETGGKGLWRGTARRRLIERMVAGGDAARLVGGDVHLIMSACALDNGRMSYFINWREPSPEFRDRIDQALGEVVVLEQPRDVIDAAVASSAVPLVFEPAQVLGREHLDGGVFSNQPLRAAVADGADAVLMVLVSPSSGPRAPSGQPNLVEVGARLQELANWRDLQTELRQLPAGWSRQGDPARVCVVEPESALSGTLLGFDPEHATELIRLGEEDAWRALEKAGWLGDLPAL